MALESEDCLKNGIELHGNILPPLTAPMCLCRVKLYSFEGTKDFLIFHCNTEHSLLRGMFDITCPDVLNRNILSLSGPKNVPCTCFP